LGNFGSLLERTTSSQLRSRSLSVNEVASFTTIDIALSVAFLPLSIALFDRQIDRRNLGTLDQMLLL
jgi:hypothetical protein